MYVSFTRLLVYFLGTYIWDLERYSGPNLLGCGGRQKLLRLLKFAQVTDQLLRAKSSMSYICRGL